MGRGVHAEQSEEQEGLLLRLSSPCSYPVLFSCALVYFALLFCGDVDIFCFQDTTAFLFEAVEAVLGPQQ